MRSLLEFEVGRSNIIRLRPNQNVAKVIYLEHPKKPSSHRRLGYDILPCCSSEAMASRLELSYFKIIYGREQSSMIAEMILEGEPSGLVRLVYDYVKEGPKALD